jgi:hypothetical protein
VSLELKIHLLPPKTPILVILTTLHPSLPPKRRARQISTENLRLQKRLNLPRRYLRLLQKYRFDGPHARGKYLLVPATSMGIADTPRRLKKTLSGEAHGRK